MYEIILLMATATSLCVFGYFFLSIDKIKTDMKESRKNKRLFKKYMKEGNKAKAETALSAMASATHNDIGFILKRGIVFLIACILTSAILNISLQNKILDIPLFGNNWNLLFLATYCSTFIIIITLRRVAKW